MKISDAGLALIQSAEGLSLRAYPDPGTGGEPITIGYGHTGDVKLGDRITEAEAVQFLREDVASAEAAIADAVTVPLTQQQFDALCSFVFNVGAAAFRKSTLLRKLNAGDTRGAADEFGKWVNAGGKPLPGLVARRKRERDLFLS